MSSTNGDYIVIMSSDNVNIEPGSPVLKKQSSSRKKNDKREFPAPVHNLSFHMPWELKRYCTSDGRLILREEKPSRRHFFRVHRANGRLTLQLVPLHPLFPTDTHHHDIPDEPVQEIEEATPSQTSDDDTDSHRTGQVSAAESPNILEAQGFPRPTNCNFNFSRVSSASSCLFEAPAASY